jgi:prepilin-type N-terminal cleavage/methylation domain-containing protein
MKNRGFTLIELMISIAIIAILIFALMGEGSEAGIYGRMKSKEVIGMVHKVVSINEGTNTGLAGDNTVRSTSVTLKTPSGEYIDFSSTDRKWFGLISEAGKKCVKARIFPYAPMTAKSGSFYAGQLLQQADTCEGLR